MALYLFFILERLEPHEAVGIDPHGIVDPGEIDIHVASSLFQEMGQQETQFIVGQGPFHGQMQFIPGFSWVWGLERLGDELIPAIGRGAAWRAHAAGEYVEEEEAAGHLPAAQITDAGAAPGVSGQFPIATGDVLGRLPDALHGHLGFFSRPLKCELPIIVN
jgi:hypothetical protein